MPPRPSSLYYLKMKNKALLTIFKIGGNVLDNPVLLEKVLKSFSKTKGAKILVHGGGKAATHSAGQSGITPVFVEGRRVTDKPMLDIAVMTYAGLINKSLVAQLQFLGMNAIGLSGADANIISSSKRMVGKVDYGWVGDIEKVDGDMITSFLTAGLLPVFCAITHDGKGQLLNTNADTIAAEIAIACTATYRVVLDYCFEKKGVLADSNDEESVISVLDHQSCLHMEKSGSIHSGMLPKLHNCFIALQNGVSEVRIGGPDMLETHEYTALKL